jgi:hypothetical protein
MGSWLCGKKLNQVTFAVIRITRLLPLIDVYTPETQATSRSRAPDNRCGQAAPNVAVVAHETLGWAPVRTPNASVSELSERFCFEREWS